MHFVNEKHLPVAEIGKDRGQIALDLQRGAGGLLKGSSKFVGNNVCERSLAEPRRPVEQHMIKRFAARFCRLYRDVKILFDLGLANEFLQTLGPKLELKRRIVLNRRSRDEAVFQVQREIVFGSGHCKRW